MDNTSKGEDEVEDASGELTSSITGRMRGWILSKFGHFAFDFEFGHEAPISSHPFKVFIPTYSLPFVVAAALQLSH